MAKWIEGLKRTDWLPQHFSRLCSDHFAPESFDWTDSSMRLRADAVPSFFSFPKGFSGTASQNDKSLIGRDGLILATDDSPTGFTPNIQNNTSEMLAGSADVLLKKLDVTYDGSVVQLVALENADELDMQLDISSHAGDEMELQHMDDDNDVKPIASLINADQVASSHEDQRRKNGIFDFLMYYN
jgi:hypothetical protein